MAWLIAGGLCETDVLRVSRLSSPLLVKVGVSGAIRRVEEAGVRIPPARDLEYAIVLGKGADSEPATHRILAVVRTLNHGGAETLLVEQARALRELGHELDVAYDLAHHGPLAATLESMGCGVLGVRGLHRRPHVVARRSVEYCVVHTHSPLPAATIRIALAAARCRSGVVHTEHSAWSAHHIATRFANRSTFRLVDRGVAVSQAVARSMSSTAQHRTETIFHGIDAEALAARAICGRGRLRRLLGLADDVAVVATVANLRPEKDYPNLVAAAAEVLKTRPQTHFVGIGRGRSMPQVEGMVNDLGLSDRFHLLGGRDDAVELLADADVFVLASRSEGLPVALMEAMALSLPVVATSVGGVPELLRPEGGICVPPREPHRLAEAVAELLADPDRARLLGAGGRRAIESWSPRSTARRLTSIYDEVCGGHERAHQKRRGRRP